MAKHAINRLRWIGAASLALLILQGCKGPPSTPQAPALFGEPLILQEGAEWRFYPLIVDINGDDHPDIVATHRKPLDQNALHIWLGNGAGAFEEVAPKWSSPGYSGLAAGDIDQDGHLDLLAVSHFNRIHTLLADGAGGFNDTVHETPDGYVAARLSDVNGDRHLDAVVLGNQKAGIEVYLGDGTGHWTLATRLLEGNIGRDLSVADLNNDGHPDIVASMARQGIVVYLGDGAGGWSGGPTGFYSATGEFRSLALDDVNQDGHLDIGLNGGDTQEPPTGPEVYLSDGKGGWSPSSDGLRAFPFPGRSIALGDVDNDDHPDLVAGGSMIDERSADFRLAEAMGLFLFRGDGRGNWALHPDSGLPSRGLMHPYGIALGDLNQDGRLDMVVTQGAPGGTGGNLTVWIQR